VVEIVVEAAGTEAAAELGMLEQAVEIVGVVVFSGAGAASGYPGHCCRKNC